jgi:hypothetical protein
MPMRDYEGLEKTLLDISDIYRCVRVALND